MSASVMVRPHERAAVAELWAECARRGLGVCDGFELTAQLLRWLRRGGV